MLGIGFWLEPSKGKTYEVMMVIELSAQMIPHLRQSSDIAVSAAHDGLSGSLLFQKRAAALGLGSHLQ